MNYNQAQERVAQLKKFYKSLIGFGIVAIIIYGKCFFRQGKIQFSLFHGSVILTIWAIVLVVRAVNLFMLNPEWEYKMLRRELKRSKEPINFNEG